ncbi:hypothetical protein NECAME_13599 [Necator americanus]|uniref:Uncharacterized protein n=1 Tax=Necator americanus TaxID=51031 RepID=W2SWH0_NECAM|nr:hypothetical protein NECAME_13599 [Necator americanus]ETN73176.1 hypothetical protein NECAME_13599 [Necator americanus]
MYPHGCIIDDRPAPEQSCTNLIKLDEEDETFPVISLTFNLNDSPELDEFPEESFRDTIAGALRVRQVDIVILRVNCMGTVDSLTVQFGVLKSFENIKYDADMFVDAESVATRMKAMGHLNQIADLQVLKAAYLESFDDWISDSSSEVVYEYAKDQAQFSNNQKNACTARIKVA